MLQFLRSKHVFLFFVSFFIFLSPVTGLIRKILRKSRNNYQLAAGKSGNEVISCLSANLRNLIGTREMTMLCILIRPRYRNNLSVSDTLLSWSIFEIVGDAWEISRPYPVEPSRRSVTLFSGYWLPLDNQFYLKEKSHLYVLARTKETEHLLDLLILKLAQFF